MNLIGCQASNRITHVKLQGFPKLRHLDLAENMCLGRLTFDS